jgi:hypothetical protein
LEEEEDENYGMFANIVLDNPHVRLVGQVVGYFVLWPMEFMELDMSF